jgi:nitroreductase
LEFKDVLRRRRMVRHYAPEPVRPEVLERIVGTVRRIPTAGFSQGVRLVVVTDPATRAELTRIADEPSFVEEGLEPWVSSAPVHIFVCVREGDYHHRYTQADKLQDGSEIEWPVPYWHFDAGAAALALLLAAVDEGLAAGVYGVRRDDETTLRELLGVPADVRIDLGVTIGRPAPDPRWSEKASRRTWARKPLDELVRWERWS